MSSEDKTPIMRESEDKTPKYNTQDDATPKMQRDRRGSESPIIQKEDSKEDKTDEQINKATNIDEMNGVSIIPTELSTTASLLANMGCRSVENFEKLNKIQEGTYGVVCMSNNITVLALIRYRQSERQAYWRDRGS